MTILTVNPQGQIIVDEDVVKHLGAKPGDRVELNLLPGGRAEIAAAGERKLTFRDVEGMLHDSAQGKVFTIEEIDEAIADSWARAGIGE
ncbi:AbrB/MazE/SpoVT family DNA-binding domain-containing protein [Rhizobium sp. C4]|uniref:AbrB/MazE/SpoVT family DNA-binding domain-containing protein n=1 Tax=Rhizobium sp. C4 TaxID=1349800 RepID=UPI001E2F1DA7|nr:AbrB/MazE/SpoVT family DNA-binding domain-containing protein [Rhizobium sp. C4]MCD2172581.1 AbrB/MazE/SpoVT family DNA-binding domain-containing protein [Rhizobium sp. C4]